MIQNFLLIGDLWVAASHHCADVDSSNLKRETVFLFVTANGEKLDNETD